MPRRRRVDKIPTYLRESIDAQTWSEEEFTQRLQKYQDEIIKHLGNVSGQTAINPVLDSSYDAYRLREVLKEIFRRRVQGLSLYRPMPLQEQFHQSRAPERVIRGSNRSGKTVAGAVEVARAVLGRDPYDKYPKRDGICYIVGFDERHLSKVMWPKLSRAGAFKIIRDTKTNMWRAWLPTNPEDLARRHLAKPAPPLIPASMISHVSWNKKKENLPSNVRLSTGWQIEFYSSRARPQKGSAIHLAWFDEELEGDQWYTETAARLVDFDGMFIWTATPQAGTEQLYTLHERAEEQRSQQYPIVQEFVSLIDDNEYLTDDQRRNFIAKMSEEERNVRVGGEFVFKTAKVFPEFSKSIHCFDYFEIPKNWTIYVSVDPGRQVCAATFLAVPDVKDERHREFVYIFDELYLRNCDANDFGREMAAKMNGRQIAEAFIIDHQQGRVTEMGSGISVETHYSEALRRYGVRSRSTGHNFVWGNPDVKSGIEAIRSWLRPTGLFGPKLRVFEDKCPNLLWEFAHYRYQRKKGPDGSMIVTDEPEYRGRVHQMANLRYLSSYDPQWRDRPLETKRLSPAYKAFKNKMDRKKNSGMRSGVNLGPGA